jgi:hypothetical protein
MKHYKVLKLGNVVSAVPDISVEIDFLQWIESKHIFGAQSQRSYCGGSDVHCQRSLELYKAITVVP